MHIFNSNNHNTIIIKKSQQYGVPASCYKKIAKGNTEKMA